VQRAKGETMSEQVRLTRSEKLAVRLAIKSALHLRRFPNHYRAHYCGILDGISLVAKNLGYARRVVKSDRHFERMEKLIGKASKS
jgi:hypothetical protein